MNLQKEIKKLSQLPLLHKVAEALAKQKTILRVGGFWGSAQAFLLSAVMAKIHRPMLILLADDDAAEDMADDLQSFAVQARVFPATESTPADPEMLRERMHIIMNLLQEAKPRVLTSSLRALMQPLPLPHELEKNQIHLRVGKPFDPATHSKLLDKMGYTQRTTVSRPGEYNWRGAIFDFFPFTAEQPLRLEIFSKQLVSLRTFVPHTQRSANELSEFAFYRTASLPTQKPAGLLFDYLASDTILIAMEPALIQDREEKLFLPQENAKKIKQILQSKSQPFSQLEIQTLPTGSHDLPIRSLHGLSKGMRQAAASLRLLAESTARIYVYCRTQAEQKRLRAILTDQGLDPHANVALCVGNLTQGFSIPAIGASFLNHNELMGVSGVRRKLKKSTKQLPTKVIRSFMELQPGDLVVHEIHGVAKFHEMQRLRRDASEEDHLVLEFAEDSFLYVPASRIDLVKKYIGAGGIEPKLDKIGSGSFLRRKQHVQKAVIDMAVELLEVQALRATQKGIRYLPDDELQRDFEASFPFQDTDDQEQITHEIKQDLIASRPMDRLICGDVGFGKTELAVRAAFKVVSANKQVAVLVPTTILAEQHYRTFRERFADYPVGIEALSRFRSDREQKMIIERLAQGKVDILIGTHRILSGDVIFKDLGLVIIDEEQRFGVRHKERLKQLRATVDILTLTATPIPRTLHMALTGIRDISSLRTPPLGREAIETLIHLREDDTFVQAALRYEINRGGQVFFLHNRVHSIEKIGKKIQQLVPQASIAIAHGQMPERMLETIMHSFVQGEIDILVTTSIIESGLDIPRANTMIIDQAQHFGLADLHQLRGRVGRGRHKAFCILLIPKNEPLAPAAKARLKAIEELQDLGSGFAIAMRDLEIRGAGNILGAEQSGHIGAVGYDMYCRLLKTTVQKITHAAREKIDYSVQNAVDLELGVDAFLPSDYVQDPKLRLGLLRELDDIRDPQSRTEIEKSIRDRFGPIPHPALNLCDLFLIKRMLAPFAMQTVHFRKDRFIVEYKDRNRLQSGLAAFFPEIRFVDEQKAHIIVSRKPVAAAAAFAKLRAFCMQLQVEPLPSLENVGS